MSSLITSVEHALATAASDTVKVAKFVETAVLPVLKTTQANESTIESITSLFPGIPNLPFRFVGKFQVYQIERLDVLGVKDIPRVASTVLNTSTRRCRASCRSWSFHSASRAFSGATYTAQIITAVAITVATAEMATTVAESIAKDFTPVYGTEQS